jgi:hypothetical protein
MQQGEGDYTIDAAKWHTRDPLAKAALAHHEMSWRPILEFLRANDLLRSKDFGSRWESWTDFELKVSDLTTEGHELVRRCLGKWANSVSRIDIDRATPEKMQKRVEIWSKAWTAMRNGEA